MLAPYLENLVAEVFFQLLQQQKFCLNNNNEKKAVLFLLNGNQEGDTRLLSEEQAPNQKLSSKRRKQTSRWWGRPPLCHAQQPMFIIRAKAAAMACSTRTQHSTALWPAAGQDSEPISTTVRAARDELMMTRKNTAAKGSRTCRVLQHRARHVPLSLFFSFGVQYSLWYGFLYVVCT